jgi:hypothetical protein
MKNQYDLSEDGQTVTIWCYGQGAYHGCLIDVGDLPKVDSMPNTWYALWQRDILDYYAVAHARTTNGKRRLILMHRLITDAPQGLYVDHWNHECLDNRRENLRVVTNSANIMNRLGATRASKTGERGVDHFRGKYRLQLTIDGKRKYVGCYPTIEQAITARNQFPEYARSA